MVKIDCEIQRYYSTEEFFAFFMYTHKLGDSILKANLVTAKHLIEHLESENYIDDIYIKKIKENFGSYFVGIGNAQAIFDFELIIDFILKKEKLNNLTREDIEKYFIYHISIICIKDTYARKDLIKNISDYYFRKHEHEAIDIKTQLNLLPIDNKTKSLKLSYINVDSILEEVEALAELINENDKDCQKLINNIRERLM